MSSFPNHRLDRGGEYRIYIRYMMNIIWNKMEELLEKAFIALYNLMKGGQFRIWCLRFGPIMWEMGPFFYMYFEIDETGEPIPM